MAGMRETPPEARLRSGDTRTPVLFLTAKDVTVLRLSPTEFKLLRYLMTNPRAVPAVRGRGQDPLVPRRGRMGGATVYDLTTSPGAWPTAAGPPTSPP